MQQPPVCRKSDTVQTAPSDEGAVSEADWGRENVMVLTVNTDKTVTFTSSLPQSPAAPAPSSEGALVAVSAKGFIDTLGGCKKRISIHHSCKLK